MKVLISGSTGFIGSALVAFLKDKGWTILRLVREFDQPSADAIMWDPGTGRVDLQALEGLDAVINLAGENIASRWNEEKKHKIFESRVNGTQNLCATLAQLQHPPKVLVNASAVGYYGNQGDKVCIEDSPSGAGFLAEVCRQWEAATEAASQRGIRVVLTRFGVVLSPEGGALKQLLIPFKLGIGGVVGTGRQWMSWVALDDLLEIIHFGIVNPFVKGPINVVAPDLVTNEQFTKILGKVINRPTVFPLPAFAAKLAFGTEAAEEMLLSSIRAEPARLRELDYHFRYPTLEGTFKYLLDKKQ